ncbi:hypothetical protein OAD74_05625 [Alphaproteobacteria bacterium]|nr:hypothetical protein [Alphaproteobacteria bacterium]
MSYLIPILSQFDNHYKMMLILTPDLTLLVLAGVARLYADEHTKAQMQYMPSLKLLKKQSQNAATNHAKTDILFTTAAY